MVLTQTLASGCLRVSSYLFNRSFQPLAYSFFHAWDLWLIWVQENISRFKALSLSRGL